MSEWKYSTIDQSCEILDIYRIPLNEEVRYTKHGVIPYYGANGVQGHIDEYLFDEPLILIAEDGGYFDEYETRPIAYRVYGKSWVNNHAHILRTKPGFGQDYIFYSLVHKNILPYIKGGTRAKLNQNELKQIQIYHPESLDEQLKVSQVLNKVDEVIEKTEAAIDKYQAIKTGIMQDLFTRGIDTQTGKLRPTNKEAPELYKESELGWIPKEWEIASLSEVCGMKSGDGITSKSIDEYGRYPVYGGNGLRGYTANYTHEGSYVLIGRQGALCGNVKRVDGIFYASEHAVVVSVNSDTNVDWLSYILDSMNLNAYSEASAQPGLAVGKILRLRIRVPQLIEQRMIASVIQSLNTKIEAETALYSEYNQIKQGLMADLLTGNVRVNLKENKVENG